MRLFTDQIIVAYGDGELDVRWAAELEAAIAADPALAARVARHRALRDLVGGAFAETLAEPVPRRLLAAAGVGWWRRWTSARRRRAQM